ncbi:MAG: Diguanylate cyclase/phosphodiesterase with sensor(S) [Acidimicrobiales bacterium]|nr:Diguanylate cyclase/phosphodiesterase with sensor(S) [Acidimicrobiales bacterium]
MALLRRFAPLLVSVGVVVALGAVGLLASASANKKAEGLHRRDRQILQQTLAGLGKQYVLFAVKEEYDFASSGSWNLKVGDPADLTRLQGYVSHSPLLNYGAALMSLDNSALSVYAVDSVGVPGPSDPGYKPMVAALRAKQPGVSSVMTVGNIPVVGLAVPVMVDGTPRAVLVAYWRADSSPLQTYVEQLRYGKTGRGAVVDSNGDVVAATDKATVGHRYNDPSVVASLPKQRTGFVEITDHGDEESVSYAPLGIGGWSSLTEQSSAEFFGPLKTGRQRIDLTLFAVLAVAALALAVLNHKRHAASRREEEALRRSEERFRSLVQNGFDVVTVSDAEGTVLYDSPAIERVLGYTADERLGKSSFDYLHPDDRGRARDILARALETPRMLMQLEVRARRSDGSWRWLEMGITNLLEDPTVGGVVANMRDITERRAFQEQLTHQAYHDALTLLPNRALFQSRLEVALARASRRKRTIAVLFVDLDRFKIINDSLGHETGDELLRAVADRLQDEIRDEDIVARMSGDEFTVLLEEVEDDAEAARVAQRMIDAIRRPIDLGGHQVFVGASIGIALSHNGEDGAEDLLRDADLAMYRAKERGRSRYEIFETTMGARARLRLDLEAELRRALDADELVLHYQPEVNLLTGQIIGTEALVRWQHPERGLLGPDAFIPMAEDTGLILGIGRQVLEKACVQAAKWQQRFTNGNSNGANGANGSAPLRMSVNVSGRQLPTLLFDVTDALESTGLNPHSLVLEITESVVMDDPEAVIPTLKALRALGVQLAIDDFGTGYSSLSWLKHFPISTLKLDKSFVQGLGVDPADRAIAQSVLTMAACLEVSVTAEGIETPAQAEELVALGCRNGQGYHYARPQSAARITRLLREKTRLGRTRSTRRRVRPA